MLKSTSRFKTMVKRRIIRMAKPVLRRTITRPLPHRQPYSWAKPDLAALVSDFFIDYSPFGRKKDPSYNTRSSYAAQIYREGDQLPHRLVYKSKLRQFLASKTNSHVRPYNLVSVSKRYSYLWNKWKGEYNRGNAHGIYHYNELKEAWVVGDLIELGLLDEIMRFEKAGGSQLDVSTTGYSTFRNWLKQKAPKLDHQLTNFNVRRLLRQRRKVEQTKKAQST